MKEKIRENRTKIAGIIGATVVAVGATIGIVKIVRNRKNNVETR